MGDTPFIRGAEKLARRIATIRANASFTLNTAVDEAGELILRNTRERFQRGVDPDGNKWAPLKQSTIDRKQYSPTHSGNRNRPLFRTGSLYESIQLIRGRADGLFATSSGTGVRIGIGQNGSFGPAIIGGKDISKYARLLQNGIPGRMPARRFLGIGKQDIDQVDSMLRRRLKTLINNSG